MLYSAREGLKCNVAVNLYKQTAISSSNINTLP